MKQKKTPLPGGVLVLAIVLSGCGSTDPAEFVLPPADGEAGRWVYLEGAANTRDIGGYATQDGRSVRWNTVYRSGTLSHVTDAGCEAFRQLGVATVIDFRNRLSPLPPFDGDVLCIHLAANVLGFPIAFESTDVSEEFYIQGVRDNIDSYRQAFMQLADPASLPVLYHCAAGTDRTGVMTALLLSLLGVDRETVIEDFRLSELVDAPGNLVAMEALLDEIEATGGIEAYLLAIGVSTEAQASIRDSLCE